MSARPERCDVCGRKLCARGKAATAVCQRCRSVGAEFARNWMADLRTAGLSSSEIGAVVGAGADTVRARLNERRHQGVMA